jgi:hypothetical protein
MSALRWAAVPVIAGVLTSNAALASAQGSPPPAVPAPAPAAAPTTDPSPAPTTDPSATPAPPVSTPAGGGEDHPTDDNGDHHDGSAPGTVYYVTTTTTTTTTNVNAPITVVTAPISTTLGASNPARAAGRLVLNLGSCARRRPLARTYRVRRARVRLARNATLVVRLNGRRVAALRVPSAARRRHRPRGVALRVHLAPNGMLTIRRPSGRIMAVQGCNPN